VRVRVAEHQGRQRVDIREWFLSDKGEWCPGRRGIGIKPEHVGELAQMVARAEALLAGKVPQSRPRTTKGASPRTELTPLESGVIAPLGSKALAGIMTGDVSRCSHHVHTA
jgi:hypothetical protein